MDRKSTVLKGVSVMLLAIMIGTSCQKSTLTAPDDRKAVTSNATNTSGEASEKTAYPLYNSKGSELGAVEIFNENGIAKVAVSFYPNGYTDISQGDMDKIYKSMIYD